MAVQAGARVGVLMGGMSSEREVSLQSGQAVLTALQARGWDAVGIDAGRDLPARLIAERIDAAWIALHGRYGEDGCVQGLLEVMGIPYTGSGVAASAVAMDKIATKRAVRGLPGVVLARDAVLRPGDTLPDGLPFPVICKPPRGGSTVNMGRAADPAALARALEDAAEGREGAAAEVLVEEIVVGDEITVAVLDGVALPVVRILPAEGFYDYAAKYTSGTTRYEVPAALPPGTADAASGAAVAAYRALGCRGLARADFLVRPDGTPVFLEINTIPGMTATSLSPKAAAAVGIGFEALVERVLLGAALDP